MRPLTPRRKARHHPRSSPARPSPANKAPRASREAGKAKSGTVRRTRGQAPGRLRALFFRPLVLTAGIGAVAAVLAALLVTGTAGRAAHRWGQAIGQAMGQAGFVIQDIHIAGARRTPAITVAAALDLHPGQSIFTADLAAARARLLALDWIASADVVRRYPDSIAVTLVEKKPFALWSPSAAPDGQARIAVVERSGGVITSKGVDGFSRLPKLIGAGAPLVAAPLVDAVAAHRAIAARIAAYEYVSQRRWNLILNDGVVVQLPESGWRGQLDALEHLIIDKGVLERDISEIDLRAPTHYFFLLRNGDKKDVERGKET